MTDLSTEYMGLTLKNPIVIGSSSLTNTVEKIKRLEEAGAGAVVLKSLFEEQIRAEKGALEHDTALFTHPEAYEYIDKMSMELGPESYLKLIKDAKESVSIPVIASLNCTSSRWWIDYAKKIELAGADALELNISFTPGDFRKSSVEIENLYFDIFEKVKRHIDLPVAVKVGPFFTNFGSVAAEFCKRGTSALVLFNRFYQFDIDINRLEISGGIRMSSPQEMEQSLRWISLLSGKIMCDLAASTGIFDAAGVIKQLLAGAKVVEIVSTLFINGIDNVKVILKDIEKWMTDHKFTSIDQFRGKLNQLESENPEMYERLQYIKAIVGVE
ncbi:dihydroorotate dehydrogenase-like protein [candidate division KSB1 bacterium]